MAEEELEEFSNDDTRPLRAAAAARELARRNRMQS